MPTPDVSVVVIAYNDAENLPVAVASVTRQTLRNLEIVLVDDASTDGTSDVADQLAATDDRIRVVHLDQNSGGCSRPRNVGVDVAQGTYVMFLDSDDELERHACKNLLYAAERNDADIAAGLCVRMHLLTGRIAPWHPYLYAEPAVYDSITDNPDQLWDTLSTNKLYRRQFLMDNELRFPEGLHYEDLLFITEAYCMARRIAVVRNTIYVWNKRDEESHRSITSRTDEISNFKQRMEIHRRIKAYLRSHGHAELESVVDNKFLRHDLKIYFDPLAERPSDYQREVMDLAAEYLEHVSEEALLSVSPTVRARAFFIRARDLEETLATTRQIVSRRLTMNLVERDGRIYATERYLEDPLARTMLDVTESEAVQRPFSLLPFHNQVTRMTHRGGGLQLEGTLHDPLHTIDVDSAAAAILLRSKRSESTVTTPVELLQRSGASVAWVTTIDFTDHLPLDSVQGGHWSVRFRVTGAAGSNAHSVLVAEDLQPVSARLKSWTPGVGVTISVTRTPSGKIALQTSADGLPLRVRGRIRRVWRRSVVGKAYRRAARWLDRESIKAAAYRRIFSKLPVIQGQILFETHMGRQYGDSPKYIYQAVLNSDLKMRPVWSYAGDPRDFPSEAKLVRRNSWAYYMAVARSQYWIDNQGLPKRFTKRPETTYVQTWHGTPLKKMGFDLASLRGKSLPSQESFISSVNRWDYLVVQNEHTVETLVPAYRYNGTVLRTGYPRNDLLVTGGDEVVRERVREALDIPPERKVLLYAPTFRSGRIGADFRLQLDLPQMFEALANEYLLLIRTHYLDKYKLPARYRSFARNVGSYDDITELLLITDVLITDYSSVMFDFANTGRPMVFFTYDADDYLKSRGAYFNLRETAPGPVVQSVEDLVAALVDIDRYHSEYAGRYRAFAERYCEYDTGKSSEAVLDHVLRRPV